MYCVICILLASAVEALDVKPQRELYTPDYRIYHNVSEISRKLRDLIAKYPSFIREHETSQRSRNGLKQFVLQITNFESHHQNKTAKILMSFGEHAREFLPVETLFYLIYQLLPPRSAINLSNFEIYAIALANPDGRLYVEKSKNYCWRGTYPSGVDINRNFEWEFGGKGSSGDKNDEEYRGPYPFSEPETIIYKELTDKIHFDGFLSLHSGTRHIYIPYADTESQRLRRTHENEKEMRTLAWEMSTATKHKYLYGKAIDLTKYTADGTIFDFMAGVKNISFSYAIELWGRKFSKSPSCFDLFNPPNDQLEKVVQEIYQVYVKFLNGILNWKRNRENQAHYIQAIAQLNIPYLIPDAMDAPTMESSLLTVGVLFVLICVILVNERHFLFRRVFFK
ncbi:carboxypeptidase A4-like isoform X2 [Dreissena polymorpha]|uniref:Peptidase M14 domain-containing protein n=1 Tax=Dreissena polymorpha TaxID=45954 RepID=A0A9D4QUQ7_DREPO|nr:carboxypeptidase A4-like isoform X2 [Dreissena polymorpha]KAH3844336.1 hypothetical protein DPMN_086594 [Dreissena polymorpha]